MKKIIFLSISLIVTFICGAQQVFDDVLHQLASNNPALAAAFAATEGEKAQLRSENNLPDTEIGYEHKWSDNGLGAKWGVSISQGFEWPGVYAARGKAINSSSQALDQLYRSKFLDKLVELKLLLIDIVNTRKNLEIIKQLEESMTQLREKYQKSYLQGETSILDIKKIEIQQISISRQYNSLVAQMAVLESRLLAENGGLDCSEMIASLNEYPEDILLPTDSYLQLLEECEPLLYYGSLQRDAMSYNLKASRLSRLPGFSVGYIHENELGEHFNGFSVGLSLPFFSQRHKVAAAKSMLQATTYDMDAIRIEQISKIYAQRANAVSLFKEIETYRPIFEDSDNLMLLRKALDGGEISLLDYLQEVNYFLEARKDYMDVIYQYHCQLAQLNRYTLLK